MIERIVNKEKLYSIIIRKKYEAKGIEFFTPDEYSQQLAYMNREKGHIIAPHIHNKAERTVFYTQEVLIVRKGEILVDFYDDNKIYIESRTLYEGDIILLARGGHGFTMLQDSEMIEVKQGPFMGDSDKTRFLPK